MASFQFKKSSYSGPQPDAQECVEVAVNVAAAVAIRDSKDPEGPVLTFPPTEWTHFQHALAAGTLTL